MRKIKIMFVAIIMIALSSCNCDAQTFGNHTYLGTTVPVSYTMISNSSLQIESVENTFNTYVIVIKEFNKANGNQDVIHYTFLDNENTFSINLNIDFVRNQNCIYLLWIDAAYYKSTMIEDFTMYRIKEYI